MTYRPLIAHVDRDGSGLACEYHEEHHVPLLLAFPLIAMGAGVVVASALEELDETQRGAFAVGAIALFCGLLILTQFMGPNIDVKHDKVSFSFFLLRHTIPLSNIESFQVHTFIPLNNSDYFGRGYGYGYYRMWVPPAHCVDLKLTNGASVSIATQHPGALLHALRMAKGMAI